MTFVYRAYGLNIRSDIPIQFLTGLHGEADIDVDICFRPNSHLEAAYRSLKWQPDNGREQPGIGVSKHAGQLKLLYPRDPESALEFVISADHKTVTVLRPDAIPEIDAISFFIGPISGVLSRLRCRTCLHAGVLMVDGRAFALTGSKEAGKSTTSAILTTLGAELVADDIAVLSYSETQFWVAPGYPFMRLSRPEIELTGRSMTDTHELLSIGDKRYVAAPAPPTGSFLSGLIPLEAVYVLSERGAADASICIEKVEPQKAARLLNSNRYGEYVMDAAMQKRDFSFFAKFAREKHIRTIARPNDLSRLKELGDKILEDFGKLND